MNPAAAKKPVAAPECPDIHAYEAETDARRKARVSLTHRKALRALACVTLRYQVHNELSAARRDSEDEVRESESRIRARAR